MRYETNGWNMSCHQWRTYMLLSLSLRTTFNKRQMVLGSIACWARSAATSAFAAAILLNILLNFFSPLRALLPAGMLSLSAMVSFCTATMCDSGDIAELVMYLCWKWT